MFLERQLVNEVWLDGRAEDGWPILRVAAAAGDDGPTSLRFEGDFWTPLSSPEGVFGYLRMRFAGVVKGQAVFEAVEMRPVGEHGGPPPQTGEIARLLSDFTGRRGA